MGCLVKRERWCEIIKGTYGYLMRNRKWKTRTCFEEYQEKDENVSMTKRVHMFQRQDSTR